MNRVYCIVLISGLIVAGCEAPVTGNQGNQPQAPEQGLEERARALGKEAWELSKDAASSAAEVGREAGETAANEARGIYEAGKATADEYGEVVVEKSRELYGEAREKADELVDQLEQESSDQPDGEGAAPPAAKPGQIAL